MNNPKSKSYANHQKHERARFMPFTPAGTPLAHLISYTRQGAIDKLLKDAAHMPYDGWQGFYDRGYRVEQVYGSP